MKPRTQSKGAAKPPKPAKPSRADKRPLSAAAEPAVERWNAEDAAELDAIQTGLPPSDLVVFSRDWTVKTIVEQISDGNVDLDPDFQRRNAWHDERRSKLIESFILGFPVPQIVLAEDPKKKSSFIVIDGKQRLLTIAGFYLEKYRTYWQRPALQKLTLLAKLNGVPIPDFFSDSRYADEVRQLGNADIRTTIITHFKNNEGLLYDIFYRLNTGSVALSSQELRQVLHRGAFSRHLTVVTDERNPLWDVLGLDRPDPRFRDVELLLRLVALAKYAADYKGNLKPFLDESLDRMNRAWSTDEGSLKELIDSVLDAIKEVNNIYAERAGRKFKSGRYETQLNRAVFEVQVYFLIDPNIRAQLRSARVPRARFVNAFEDLCTRNSEFLISVEATTKSVENYRTRFHAFQELLEKILGVTIPALPM